MSGVGPAEGLASRDDALLALPVLVLDLQSSGATPAHGHVLEMAWAQARAAGDSAEVAGRLVALPEGARIPRAVSRITGITQHDLAGAEPVELAWGALREVAQKTALSAGVVQAPTVIHYARFETSFLRDLHRRFASDEPFALDIVCTHDIAKRLHPELPRRGLRALAGYYGFPVELLRRSEGHVAATVFAWHHLVTELGAEGVARWSELRQWLAERPARRAKRSFPMPRKKRLSLPDKPGVYRFLRTSGDVLYVGKATSLKKRVNSYFTKRSGQDERLLEMLSQARDLAVTETVTVLEAALLETAEIKRHSPPYNIHLQQQERQVWFASCDFALTQPEPSAQCPIGPLPSRFWLSAMAAFCQLLDGDERDEHGIGRAVGARRFDAPQRACFEQGLALFNDRYQLDRMAGSARQRLAKISKTLSGLSRAGQLDEGGDRGEDEPSWDPERVARHLERIVLHTGQLSRRARWLCLLSDATVGWLPPGQSTRRMLVVRAGRITERGFLEAGAPLPVPESSRSHRARQSSFDIATYDRLRILSTELRRVSIQSEASVRINRRPALSGERLRAALDCA